MKKVFLMAYARKNLGDDLFLKMILERYPKCDFYIMIDDYEFLLDLRRFKNLHILHGKDTDEELCKINVNDYDAYIYVGGSIFMEGGKVYNLSNDFYNFVRKCKKQGKPFFYLSCNFGPYKTHEYFELSQDTFKEATDVCFRDKYSYNLFNDIQSVRYAPDLAFSYKIEQSEKIPNSIGISIIDLDIRHHLKHKDEHYINFLVNNINKYLKDNKKVYLYTFCNEENDERTLNMILERLSNNSNVYEIKYSGDINEFLNIYTKMEYMICSRFHAMILSCISRQKMYIMSYSKKIDNVIDDLELQLPILDFNDIKEDMDLRLEDFVLPEELLIENIIKEASKQELKIKNILN